MIDLLGARKKLPDSTRTGTKPAGEREEPCVESAVGLIGMPNIGSLIVIEKRTHGFSDLIS